MGRRSLSKREALSFTVYWHSECSVPASSQAFCTFPTEPHPLKGRDSKPLLKFWQESQTLKWLFETVVSIASIKKKKKKTWWTFWWWNLHAMIQVKLPGSSWGSPGAFSHRHLRWVHAGYLDWLCNKNGWHRAAEVKSGKVEWGAAHARRHSSCQEPVGKSHSSEWKLRNGTSSLDT